MADWRRNTVYTNEFHDEHPVVQAFWSIVSAWSTRQRSLLLCFATGYAYPPVGQSASLERRSWGSPS